MIRDDSVWMVGVIRCVHVDSRERQRQRERERESERNNRIGASFYYVSKLDTQVVDHDPRRSCMAGGYDKMYSCRVERERQGERERETGREREIID